MRVDLFDYELPKELIAAKPADRRDASRLLVLDRQRRDIQHKRFSDIGQFLREGDLLVLNNSKVIPARLRGKRLTTGGQVEFLLVRQLEPQEGKDRWLVLCRPAKKLKPGEKVYFSNKRLEATILHYACEGEREVIFNCSNVLDLLNEIGEIPLPPYIIQRRRELYGPKRLLFPEDIERYQTVYATALGSVAAPTAGLHFTHELLEELVKQCVSIATVTLHVGPGTFKPVEVDEVEKHQMHSEVYEIPEETVRLITETKEQGKRVVAVGTTTVRTLEGSALSNGRLISGVGETNLMIVPGFRFQVVDALITNFHLPRSTLLMLVCAFVDREFVLHAYKEAVREQYRFFSYGDAMLII
jgi:S-adenosylmethionine:tRNA ribosyltransferase-isomerase